MATIKHPVQGRPTLAWDRVGAVFTAFIEANAKSKYKRGSAYTVRETFAILRPQYNALGLFTDSPTGWVVTRNNFDEIREFSDYDTAKLYIESLFTLEFAAD